MLAPGARILVAVSGGSDSVGLLGILAGLRRKLAIALVAAHVNHRLRGADSEADEHCAAAAALRADVGFVRADLPAGLRERGNLEARARELRYAALHRLAAASGCTRIATGHTRDDQAETVLLRILRGTGVGGLAGIEPVRADGVIRPLIDCSRSEIEVFVRAAGYAYRSDSSNRDERFLRTRIRHRVMPVLRDLNPAVVDNLARVASQSAAESAIIQAWTQQQLDAAQRGTELDIGRLGALAPGLQRHVVRAWLIRIGIGAQWLTARHVEAVMRLAQSRSASGRIRLPGATIARRYGWLRRGDDAATAGYAAYTLLPGATVAVPSGWRIEADPIDRYRVGSAGPRDLWSAVCDASALTDSLIVRSPRAGERLRPLGLGGGHRKLSDVFIDRKIPLADRGAYPVVSYGEEIVWVPGVARSQVLPVREGTTAIIRLRASRTHDAAD
jgi:tRNA(Ile)-lysidine synthase